MSLTNDDYNDIINEYNTRQLENENRLSERRKEIYAKIPAYKESEDARISLYASRARILIKGDTASADALTAQIEEKTNALANLLTSAGYPEDYLTLQYTCPLCHDTGFVDGTRCRCFKQALLNRLYEKSNIREVLKSENFSTLRHDLQIGDAARQFEKAYAKSVKFVEEFGSVYKNLCFSGTVGTGKSFLSNCILDELIKKEYSCIYYTAPALFDTIADYKFRHVSGLLNPTDLLYSCDLLVIDDLGTELSNSFTTSEFLTLLNVRHLNKKATIISTNLDLENLNETYSDRVFSRLFSNFDICYLSGTDIRTQIKQMQNRK